MANAYVFPGGRLDAEDASPALLERLGRCSEASTALMEGVESRSVARAHLVAAVRETFEESGILLAVRSSGERVTPPPEWQRDLNGGVRTFESLLVDEDLVMTADSLAYFAHWITPTFEPRRYDARFFLAIVPEGVVGHHDGKETTESLWITPASALERHARGDLFLAPPQWQVLGQLAAFDATRDLLAWAGDLERVAPIQPHRFTVDGTFALALPGDPEHPESGDVSPDGGYHRIVLREGAWRDG